MPSLVQLQAEQEWRDEFIPAALTRLAARLAAHYAMPVSNIGMRGNEVHLRGYHRSRRWIKNSVWATSRTYSVSRTPGDRTGGDSDAVAAMDVRFPTEAALLAACRRLDAAVRAGHLEKITEWYGNKDGDLRVDGYDNLANIVASSDPSHLWHLHMSFDRGRVDEDHTDVYETLTGVIVIDVASMHAFLLSILTADTSTERQVRDMILGGVQSPAGGVGLLTSVRSEIAALHASVADLATMVAAIGTSTPEVAAILAGVDERLAALRGQVKADTELVVDTELDEQSRAGADPDG